MAIVVPPFCLYSSQKKGEKAKGGHHPSLLFKGATTRLCTLLEFTSKWPKPSNKKLRYLAAREAGRCINSFIFGGHVPSTIAVLGGYIGFLGLP